MSRKLVRVSLLVMGALSVGGVAAQAEVCWRDSYGRGVGTIPDQCEMYQEKQGLLCYPKCNSGYTGVLNVCWQDCPAGSRDDGAFCRFAEYGRGTGFGYNPFTGEGRSDARKRCERKHGSGRCERSLEMYYPKCKPGYDAFGCCICRPSRVDCSQMGGKFDLSCAKKTYTRRTITADCAAGEEYDAGLCYERCEAGYDGVGPVCWGTCPSTHPVDCGASCATNQAACAEAVTDQVVSVLDVAANVAITAATLGTGTGAKVAASTGAKAAKVGATQAAKIGASQGLKTAARQGLKQAGRKMSKAQIKASLRETRDNAIRKGGDAAREARKMDEDKLEKLADVLDKAQSTGEAASDGSIDALEIAEIMDPTGVVAVVNAYNHPVCSGTGARTASTRTGGARPATSTARPAAVPTGWRRIQNRWYPERHIHNQNGPAEVGPIQPNWWSAMWNLEPVGDGYVRIQNRWYSHLYLHNQNGPLELGEIRPNWWSAMWKLEPVGEGWVRIQNRWYPKLHIHNQNGRLELGPIQPNWWSAMWKVE